MATKIICLANSKKFNERCVAGIEVNEKDNVFNIISTNSKPKWLRPVSKTGHGEFPASIAKNINILDVIEFDLLEPCPSGNQVENVFFDKNSVKRVSTIELSSANLDTLTCNSDTLFGNKGKAVHEEDVYSLDHSLVFIKVNKHNVFIKPKTTQLRMNFQYNFHEYDLPITDINFMDKFSKDNKILDGVQHLYLTVSLALIQNNWHSKLIAGIIYT